MTSPTLAVIADGENAKFWTVTLTVGVPFAAVHAPPPAAAEALAAVLGAAALGAVLGAASSRPGRLMPQVARTGCHRHRP